MITRVYRAIIKHLKSVVVNTPTQVKVDGEFTTTYVSGTKEIAIFPLTFKDLRYAPNGAYTLQDKKFYEIGSGTIQPKSTIELTEGTYTIDQWAGRDFDGGFAVYVGKRNPG